MTKNGTSRKHAASWRGRTVTLRPDSTTRPYDPTDTLRDPAFIQKAILQGLKLGDYEGVLETYRAHLRVLNRTHAAKAMGVSRQYIHKMLKSSTNNPSMRTFVTFMKLLREGAEANQASAQ